MTISLEQKTVTTSTHEDLLEENKQLRDLLNEAVLDSKESLNAWEEEQARVRTLLREKAELEKLLTIAEAAHDYRGSKTELFVALTKATTLLHEVSKTMKETMVAVAATMGALEESSLSNDLVEDLDEFIDEVTTLLNGES